MTPKQLEVLRCIEEYIEAHDGVSPTLRDVGQKLRISYVTVFEHTTKLIAAGHLKKVRKYVDRSLTPVKFRCPYCGHVLAGNGRRVKESKSSHDYTEG